MSRERILTLLREQSCEFLSGEQLSEWLGLSRTAIWKAINSLRQEGYGIEARAGMGYCLLSTPDVLTEAEIRAHMQSSETNGRTLICLDEVDSTNTYLRQMALEGAADGTAVVADSQTAGRGRMGRSFQSPKGKGIYLSVLYRPDLPPERMMSVTALAGLAVCDAVERLCGVRPGLKWPNDPVLGNRKLCGVLTEMALEGETGRVRHLVVGIGVNVLHTQEDFQDEVAEIATSLSMELGRPVSRSALTAALLEELDRVYAALKSGDLAAYLAAYRRDCVNLGKTVQLIGTEGRETVVAVDVDEAFGLVVRTADGQERVVRSGEVSVRGLYGYVE